MRTEESNVDTTADSQSPATNGSTTPARQLSLFGCSTERPSPVPLAKELPLEMWPRKKLIEYIKELESHKEMCDELFSEMIYGD